MANFRSVSNGGYRAQIALDWEVFTDLPGFFTTPCQARDEALIAGSWAETTPRSGGRDGKRRKAADRSRRAARKSRGEV